MKFIKRWIKNVFYMFGLQIQIISQNDSVQKRIDREYHEFEDIVVNKSIVVHETKLEPLNIVVSKHCSKRVNILLDKYFSELSGGSISNYYLAWSLYKRGFNIRCIVTAPNFASDIKHVQEEVSQWDGLDHFFDSIEIVGLPDEKHKLEVNPEDRFIARSWWTACVANETTNKLGLNGFVFFTQDYEPIFHSHNWQYALALEAYSLPRQIIFSSEILRSFFRENKIGVFSKSNGEDNSCAIENAIPKFIICKDIIMMRKKRKLLFFTRPYNDRNLFQLGLRALVEVINDKIFDKDEWEFWCIGSHYLNCSIGIAKGIKLRCIPWVSLSDYRSLLPNYDVGLSLMLSPHPSLVPLDMAAAGLVTVTNTYGIKTADKLSEISSNLIGMPSTIKGIKQGLVVAKKRAEDVEGRIAGMDLKWARTWDDTFNDKVMNKIVSWLG